MRSPVDRRAAEWLARTTVLSALVVLLWRAWSPAAEMGPELASNSQLSAALQRWSTAAPPEQIHLELTRLPSAAERDWLRALRRTGTRITWSGSVDVAAIEATATAEPHPEFLVRTAAARGTAVTVADDTRTIAEIPGSAVTAVARTSSLAGRASARTESAAAHTPVPPSPRVGRLAVLGPAGWETKFVVAALEESGWVVDTRIVAAPGVVVGALSPVALDTARYAAVLIVDAVASDAVPALIRFWRSGGGLILAGRAVGSRELSALLPGSTRRPFPPLDTATVSLASLGGMALTLSQEAVPLEDRGTATRVAAERRGIGRTVAAGYFDTWRWRLQGDEEAVARHRQWWSALAAAVAYAPDTATVAAPESAPLAAFVAAVGQRTDDGRGAAARRIPQDAILFVLAAVALLAEVASRRERGLT